MLKLLTKWVLIVAGVFAIAYLGGMLAGTSLPEGTDVTSGITISRPPENVWWVLTDYPNASEWQPQFKSARMVSTPGDKPIRWRATYADGYVVNFEVKDENFPNRLREEISDRNLPFSGGWTVELARTGDQCQVTVHSHVEIHRPFDRLLIHWFVRPQAELDRILAGLKRRVETTTVKPAPATS